MRTVNFKGMIVHHHDDDHFEIIPPRFLRWSAKTVMLTALSTDIIVSLVFLVNASDLFACLLLGSISLSLLFATGYLHESFPAIFCHFAFCILYISACLIVVPVVFYNHKVCTNSVVCKTVHEWMDHIDAPIDPFWVYFFVSVSLLSHAFMIPVSFRMIKYTAACQALDEILAKEEEEKLEGKRTPVSSHAYYHI